ncbi:LysR substrate-binding domain-containing protein [Shewanella nanhaiensis]|uniref:LysR family transcriptional regulator n=1 Tax=Shewanella nanhaiensis TaxID=2864872 RepID=A0ABS7DYL7_9GAMM|nr:LysR substrate-binding domain-containing protein [Shewanella nanhaiensis]MBW8182526.1 LysR family transcriptional regulator [Shewanella nanhaiensis]
MVDAKKHRLPSLNILRVFESAARHLSFKKAAEELFITPPAVSHQIRTLEQQLDVLLFKRLNRSLTLTNDGQVYFYKVQQSLQQLQSATDELIANKEKFTFVINSVPMVISALLAPFIHEFQEHHPDISIQMDSAPNMMDFAIKDLDVAIRRTKGEEPHLIYVPIFKVEITPICRHDYFAINPSVNPDTLENSRLIRLTADKHNWPHWLNEWDLDTPSGNELILSSFRSAIESVRSGAGIGMGYKPMINHLLQEGEIITPFPNKISSYSEAYLVYRKQDKNRAIIQAFEIWLRAIIKRLGWSE